MSDGVLDAAAEIADHLERMGIRYMIGGSVASTVWGEPRFTRDVDIVAELEQQHVGPFIQALGAGWYADESLLRDAVATRRSANVIRLEGMVKVDLFVPTKTGHHAAKWARARRKSFGPGLSRELVVTGPEDILLQKLAWYRDGGESSEQQWRDITALLRVQGGQLDEEHLDTWARKMDLSDLLHRARQA